LQKSLNKGIIGHNDDLILRRRRYQMCKDCKNKPYYLTTAIAYTSGKPHIGNTYEIVLADSIARFKRAQGYDVRFQTGTDEHGQKIELKAAEAGITPKEYVDNVSAEIKRIWDMMNTS
jgi:methionyl-tRNA synthetase